MSTSTSANATRSHWKGFSAIRYLVIFGDSYSDVGYDSTSPHPTKEDPLGVPYPGDRLWTMADDSDDAPPNWVGWLITEFAANQGILVYDYAVGGNFVEDVVRQVQQHYLPSVGKKPEWAQWSADDTLFVTWIGINDLAMAGDEAWMRHKFDRLFKQQEAVYESGARNFLFIDVPPMHITPAGGTNPSAKRGEIYNRWNVMLAQYVATFASDHLDVTTMIFSSHQTFTDLIKDPVKYGFEKEEGRKRAGAVWVDYIHPTSKVHWVVARDLASFLNAQPPFQVA
ncbi:hypothetical protein EUX98_g7625 [Antrodiella citrinella]|uniref:Uncharacterized protein n=1 Tax=Antrodiella citrinella TaxID=2447956 RepID=A0A4S4MMR6_9APHY|nr:hypothetical protein EUX98_g7625 [Antrodiella citrinella]